MKFYRVSVTTYESEDESDYGEEDYAFTNRAKAIAFARTEAKGESTSVTVTEYDIPRPFTGETVRRVLEGKSFASEVRQIAIDKAAKS